MKRKWFNGPFPPGLRFVHGEWVNWRKEKRRKRKLLLLNKAQWKAAGGNWRIFGVPK